MKNKNISLAVKYRPRTFDDVVEQSAIKTILMEQINTNSFKHAYLFCGPAGCGKTTAARIFANELNKGLGNPIEVDAASNNGVDNIREIIENAKRKSLDSEYKVYIVDECFHKDTLVSTPLGLRRISSIKTGDIVYNMTGQAPVTNVFVNNVFTNRLCCVTINGERTLTTVDHLFFTDDGWVEAQNLKIGERVYDYHTMSRMRERIHSEGPVLCSKNVFENVQEHFNIEDGNRKEMFGGSKSTDEDKQPNDESRYCSEDGSYTKAKRKFSEDLCRSRREWYLYQATDSFEPSTRTGVDTRVSNSNEMSKGGASLSYQLQSRPRLARFEDCDRGGWCRPQYEISTIARRKESSVSGERRVDSIEIYKRGDNDELFLNYFSDSELAGQSVEMYDLEVGGHPSYYVNGILVHNCHMLSTGAWNAMLKLLEEPPKGTIFIMCTTDPQKIPATILSRVQRYDFSKISLDKIVERLAYILDKEAAEMGPDNYNGPDFGIEDEALEYIAKLADGGMRDAITMLDKCISLSPDITVENVVKALGTVDYNTHFELLYQLASRGSCKAVEVVETVYNSGKDIKQFLKQFQFFILDVCKFQLFESFKYVAIPELPEYKQKMEDEDYEDLLKILDWSRQLNSDIKWEPNAKAMIETSILMYCMEGE